jgi:hypothetical protein
MLNSTGRTLAATALAAAAGLFAAPAALGAPRVLDVDAELLGGGRLHLEAETTLGARRVTFHVAGRSIRGRLTDIDREDRTREWDRVVRARGIGTGPRAIRVRACRGGSCASRTVRVFIDRDD